MGAIAAQPVALVGRETQRQLVADAVGGLKNGDGGVGLIEGAAGIGKTRLIDELCWCAEVEGLAVVAAAGDEVDQHRPFAPWVTALGISARATDPLRSRLARLIDGTANLDAGSGDGGDRYAVIDGVIELVDAQAADGLVVVVEDLHWFDSLSRLTLHHLVRALPELSPVLIVATFRPVLPTDETGRLVDSLHQRGAWRTQLDVLDVGEQLVLARALLGAEPGPGLRARIEDAGGNPFYLTELLRGLGQDGAITVDGDVAEVTGAVWPPSLRLTIVRRLAYLPDDALALLRSASVLGVSFDPADLVTIAGRPPADVAEQLRVLRHAGVLVDDHGQVRFGHALVRDAIDAELTDSERRLLHRDAARRLAETDAPAIRVAFHYQQAATPADPEAVDWLHRAAISVAANDPSTCADLLDNAAALLPPHDGRGDSLRAESLIPLADAGRLADCEQRASDLLTTTRDPVVMHSARRGLIYALVSENRQVEALEQIAIELDSEDIDDRARVGLLVDRGLCLPATLDVDGAIDCYTRAKPLAQQVGDDDGFARAATSEGAIAAARGWLEQAEQLADAAVAASQRTPAIRTRTMALHLRSAVAAAMDHLSEAGTVANDAVQLAADAGATTLLNRVHWNRAQIHFAAGRWDDALDDATIALDLLRDLPTPRGFGAFSDVVSIVYYQRDQLDAAAAAQTRIVESYGPLAVHWPTRILLRSARGHTDDALAELRVMLDLCAQLDAAVDLRVGGLELYALTKSHDRGDLCGALLELAISANRRAPRVPTLAALAQLLTALHHHDSDQARAAVAASRSGPRPFDVALACEAVADLLAAQGDRDEAIVLLREADQRCNDLGAERARARIAQRLRQLGVRQGRRGPRRRPTVGWDSLTRTEQQIVAYVAEGLTNRQIGERMFISHRTVATHLQHTFTKLSLVNRIELATAAARRDLQS